MKAGGSISNSGDTFSYAATLIYLLTGVPPQDGQDFDQLLRWYPNFPKIVEIIKACTQLDPSSRPNMIEIMRMLNGETWADIQVSRKQVEGLLKFAAIAGGIVLFLNIFSKSLVN